MGHCKNCKWWAELQKVIKPDWDDHLFWQWREEVHTARRNWGYCRLAASTNFKANVTTLAYAEDAEGYRASFVTAPDFGCIQFEAKEAE
jgi:hypothetical protein